MPDRALIFDFDGLIVDTEKISFQVWQEIYRDHGADLTVEKWITEAVGHAHHFDPALHLQRVTGRDLDRDALRALYHERNGPLCAELPILPGVASLIRRGIAAGWRLGVASNSTSAWVRSGLDRLGLLGSFEFVATRDQVNLPKPAPDVYLLALRQLGADPARSHAFEDSAPGAAAAKAAGLHVTAVPNSLTRHQDLSIADQILPSLEDFVLPE